MHDGNSEWLWRAGFAAKGALYGIIGITAIAVALGTENRAVDQTGAFASLAGTSGGEALLVVLAAGLGGYALFRMFEALTGWREVDGAEDAFERVTSFARGIVYGVFCFSAVHVIVEAGGGAGGNERSATSTVFDLPAGVVLVLLAGVVLVGVGAYQAYESLSDGFEGDLETGRMGPAVRRVANLTGTAGHAARAVVFLVVGGCLIEAALTRDPKDAVGLDEALQEIARQTLGSVLLFAVAAGLFVYGAYCLIEARYHRF